MEQYLKKLTVDEIYNIFLSNKYGYYIGSIIVLRESAQLHNDYTTNPSNIVNKYNNLNTSEKIFLTYTSDEIIEIIGKINVTDSILNDFLNIYLKHITFDSDVLDCILNKNCNITSKQLDDLIYFKMTTQSFYEKLINHNFKFTDKQYNTLFVSKNKYIFNLAQTTNIHLEMENWLYLLLKSNDDIVSMKNILDKNKLKLYNIFHNLNIAHLKILNIYLDFTFNVTEKNITYSTLYILLDKLVLLNYNFKENFVSNLKYVYSFLSKRYNGLCGKRIPFSDPQYDEFMLKFINTYKKYELKIDLNTFIDILKIEAVPSKRKNNYAYSTTFIHHIILKNKLIDFQLNVSNQSKLYEIVVKLEYSLDDFTKSLIDNYQITPSKELFNLACLYGNNILYNHAKSSNVEYSKTNFKYACLQSNKLIISDFFDNKYIPDDEDIINMCLGKGDKQKLFELIVTYNVNITPAIYEIIKLSGIDIKFNDSNIPLVNRTRLNNMCNYSVSPVIKKKYDNIEENDFDGDGMLHLRNLYLIGTLDQILMFEQKYNIKPDVLCFENGIVNKNDFVMDHVLYEHHFIPSIISIIRIKETEKRFVLMKKFYPNLCQIDYTTNISEYVVLDNKNVNENDIQLQIPLIQLEDSDDIMVPEKKKTIDVKKNKKITESDLAEKDKAKDNRKRVKKLKQQIIENV